MKLLLILFTVSITVHAKQRCTIAPQTNSKELLTVFNGILHTDDIKTCETLHAVHIYRVKNNKRSVLTDNKIKQAISDLDSVDYWNTLQL